MREPPAEFLSWREPRALPDGAFETPYHHPLVEIMEPGRLGTRAVNPIEVTAREEVERVRWRPMLWAMDGGGRFRRWANTSPESVVEGLDGYCFLRDNGAFEQIFEAVGLSDEQLRRWIDVLHTRKVWCDARGIQYRILIVPDKHSVYFDKLPGSPTPSPHRPVCQMLEQADEGLRAAMIYPLDVLRRGRTTRETTYRTDVHWTRYGAYLAYRELMATLPDVSPDRTVQEADLKGREMPFLGENGRRIDAAPETITWFDPPPVPGLRHIVRGTSFGRGQVDVFETAASHLPRAVMFRTSNSTHLFPLLMWHFSRLTAVATERFFYELVESEKPAVIISEMPERYIVYEPKRFADDPALVPEDFRGPNFAEFTGHEIPLPTSPAA